MVNDQQINPSIDPGSFRDPAGWIFKNKGQVYRQVNNFYKKNFDKLMTSGLYQKLTDENILIKHQESNVNPVNAELCYKVIKPQQLAFISYPYEWCFSQLKAAACMTLKIQKTALEHGMSLKDASAYNIQFVEGKPVMIDTLSFEEYSEGTPWIAYRQFCQHFLAPILLMSKGHVSHGRLSQLFLDGIPLDVASSMLPWQTKFSISTLIHIHLQGWAQKSGTGTPGKTKKVSKNSLLGILDNLNNKVKKIKLPQTKSVWAGYYSDTNYSSEGFENKINAVTTLVKEIQPKFVWDLGGNTGMFSRICSNLGIPVISFDLDPLAVEHNYREVAKKNEKNILPLVMDLTNPSPGIGWWNKERQGFSQRRLPDTILALALIHHLAIANNLPLELVADYFSELCRHAILEFVPKSDSQVQRLLASRVDIFDNYTEKNFESAFSKRFTISRKIKITDTERTLYLFTNDT